MPYHKEEGVGHFVLPPDILNVPLSSGGLIAFVLIVLLLTRRRTRRVGGLALMGLGYCLLTDSPELRWLVILSIGLLAAILIVRGEG